MTLLSDILGRLRPGRTQPSVAAQRPTAEAPPAPLPAPKVGDALSHSWSVVATVAESPALIRAFVAWHLAIGAERIFLFVDDPTRWTGPETILPDAVTVTLCDAAYWRRRRRNGVRPADHCDRQIVNASLAHDWSGSDWLVHIDADEYIHPRAEESIGAILARQPADVRAVHGAVYEQIFRPSARPRDFEFRGLFRSQLPFEFWTSPEGKKLFARSRDCFTRGMTAHCSPKIFLRRGLDVTRFRIHGADAGPKHAEIPSAQSPDFVLLHFDAGHYGRWLDKFGARADDDSYMQRMGPWKRGKQMALYRAARDTGRPGALEELFALLYCPSAKQLEAYRRFGAAMEVDLNIAEKLARLDARRPPAPAGTPIELSGARLSLRRGDNFTETYMLRHGRPREHLEIERLVELVRNRRALILDIGANCGLYTTVLSVNAGPGSLCRSFEPNPLLLRRLRANLALNPGVAVESHAVAISDHDGLLHLDGGRNGNLGEARLQTPDSAPDARPVKVRQLRAYAEDIEDYDLCVIKIDVEGHEAQILRGFLPFLLNKRVETTLMFEHTHMEPQILADLERRLLDGGFAIELRNEWNLILRRPARRERTPKTPLAAPMIASAQQDGRILIHAGVQRTGSTALQRFLTMNRGRLMKLGFRYPGGRKTHHRLSHALRRGEAGAEEMLAIDPPETGARTVILSAESFCQHADLGWLAEVRRRRHVEVVFYLRRQDHWIASWYNQNIRVPFDRRLATATPDRFLRQIGTFHWLDYAALIDRWSKALGPDAVSARIVEPGQVDDVVTDFCVLAGFDGTAMEHPGERRNASLPVHLIEIARCLELSGLEPAARARVEAALRTTLAHKAAPGAALLSPAQRKTILARYETSNAALAAQRFGRESLFLEPPPADDAPVFAFPDLDRETLLREWIAPVVRALA